VCDKIGLDDTRISADNIFVISQMTVVEAFDDLTIVRVDNVGYEFDSQTGELGNYVTGTYSDNVTNNGDIITQSTYGEGGVYDDTKSGTYDKDGNKGTILGFGDTQIFLNKNTDVGHLFTVQGGFTGETASGAYRKNVTATGDIKQIYTFGEDGKYDATKSGIYNSAGEKGNILNFSGVMIFHNQSTDMGQLFTIEGGLGELADGAYTNKVTANGDIKQVVTFKNGKFDETKSGFYNNAGEKGNILNFSGVMIFHNQSTDMGNLFTIKGGLGELADGEFKNKVTANGDINQVVTFKNGKFDETKSGYYNAAGEKGSILNFDGVLIFHNKKTDMGNLFTIEGGLGELADGEYKKDITATGDLKQIVTFKNGKFDETKSGFYNAAGNRGTIENFGGVLIFRDEQTNTGSLFTLEGGFTGELASGSYSRNITANGDIKQISTYDKNGKYVGAKSGFYNANGDKGIIENFGGVLIFRDEKTNTGSLFTLDGGFTGETASGSYSKNITANGDIQLVSTYDKTGKYDETKSGYHNESGEKGIIETFDGVLIFRNEKTNVGHLFTLEGGFTGELASGEYSRNVSEDGEVKFVSVYGENGEYDKQKSGYRTEKFKGHGENAVVATPTGEYVVVVNNEYHVYQNEEWVKVTEDESVNGWNVNDEGKLEKSGTVDDLFGEGTTITGAEGSNLEIVGTTEINMVFDGNGLLSLSTSNELEANYINPDGSIVEGFILEGAQLAAHKNEDGSITLLVENGEFLKLFNDDNSMVVNKSNNQSTAGGADSGMGEKGMPLPEVNTSGKIEESETSYKISGDGCQVSIRGGQMAVVGIGTEYWKGSTIYAGGEGDDAKYTKVTKGTLVITGATDSSMVYASKDGLARTKMITDEGYAFIVNYNEKGVKSAYTYIHLGKGRDLGRALRDKSLRGYKMTESGAVIISYRVGGKNGTHTTIDSEGNEVSYKTLALNKKGDLITTSIQYKGVEAVKTIDVKTTDGIASGQTVDLALSMDGRSRTIWQNGKKVTQWYDKE
jgi:hypothetical protein